MYIYGQCARNLESRLFPVYVVNYNLLIRLKSRLSHLSAVGLNDWSRVNLIGVEKVIQHAEQHCAAEHQATIIHRRRRRMVFRRPKTEEEYYNKINDSEAVGDDAESARNPPRAPHELRTRKIGE